MRLVSVSLILLLVSAAVARADWGAPQTLSSAGAETIVAGLAAAADRPALLLETRVRDGWSLRLRTTGASGRLGAPIEVAATKSSVEGAGLFAGSGSDLVAGWLEIVKGSRRPVVATGPRLADRQVLAPGPRSTQVMRMAANRRGDAVVTFWRYAGTVVQSIHAAYRLAGGRFGAAQLLATGRVSNPAVAIDQAGSAAVAWTDDRAGVQVAERRAGASAFGPAVAVSDPRVPTTEPGVAIEGGRVVAAWIVGGVGQPRTVLASERPTVTAPFEAPAAVSAPTKVPHALHPQVSLVDGQALVAWVQGLPHTVTQDRAALALRSGDGAWRPPVVRSVRAPAHVALVSLLARAPGRPPIVAMTFSRAFRYRLLTASLRADGTLGPSRPLATGGPAGYTPWLAQGAHHAWLATERVLGTGRHTHIQALLFRSS
jgi:hypothetical protein